MAEDGLEPEGGYFPPDFKEYAERELNWSRLDTSGKPDDVNPCPIEDDDCFWRGIRWVFWSRQDDYPERPLYHDNFVGSISDACPSPEVIRGKIRLALHKMILDPCLRYTLVQFWAPTKTLEDRTLLTTRFQPFALGKALNRDGIQRLCEYRMEMCREYNDCFYADAGSGEDQLGVPGRVFLHKFPEFNSMHMRDCSLKEYPQRDHAVRCGIMGYWAVPVFERSSQTCVGVLDVSIPYPSIPYPPVPFILYRCDIIGHLFVMFQECGLRCIYECKDLEMRDDDKDKDKDKNNALAAAFKELEMVLESVCKFHDLPLAMTWAPCSTCDHLFQGQHLFHSEDYFWLKNRSFCWESFKAMIKKCHLRMGQVTGRILTFPKLSYCSDVKQFNIAEYPLVPYVRCLELSGCFTMCLQNSWTGSELYVLEFFLPPISKDDENILTRLSLILRTVLENSHTFKLACSQEFGGGLSVEVVDFPNGQRRHYVRMIDPLQLGRPDQSSMDSVNSPMNVVSDARNYNLQLDSLDQLSMDPPNNGQDVFTAQQNILAVLSSEESKRKIQKIEHSKIGVRIEVPSDDILKCSKMSRNDVARKLEVGTSTSEHLRWDHGINQWPPRNMKEVHSSRPLPSNQVSASVVGKKPAFQDEDLVTIKAKYEKYTIKFQLSLLPTLVELHQEVAKRLNLEAGSYCVKYKDEEDESILMACDEDLQDCARYFRSVGKTPIVVQLEPKQTS